MKKFLLLISVVTCTFVRAISQYDEISEGINDMQRLQNDENDFDPEEYSQNVSGEQADKERLLRDQSRIGGPCASFSFTGDEDYQCKDNHPKPNPDRTRNSSLSEFAHSWIEYTCCNIVKEELPGIIASVWLWLQVCTQAMSMVTPEDYSADQPYAGEMGITAYRGGPLTNMKHYCPSDLDGGELTEWVVTTFFPVMEAYNPNFQPVGESVRGCQVNQNTGAVTVLLTEPLINGTFGHVAMVLHEDHSLELPDDLDNTHYVSFSNHRDTIGVMITGTKADHVPFGNDLKGVTQTVTLYNADVQAMLAKWNEFKTKGQMFDLLEWNCARMALEVLNEGYPGCDVPLEDQLWTPTNMFRHVKAIKPIVNVDSPNDEVAPATFRARHIYPVTTNTQEFPLGTVLVIAFVSFFANVLVVVVVASIVIARIRESGESKLETGLAKMLLSAYSNQNQTAGILFKQREENATDSDTSHSHSEAELVTDDADLELPPSNKGPRLSSAQSVIAMGMDENDDGLIDHKEFSDWVTKLRFPLSEAEKEAVWTKLDKNGDGTVDKQEWRRFILKRKKIKWLINRMQSSRRVLQPVD